MNPEEDRHEKVTRSIGNIGVDLWMCDDSGEARRVLERLRGGRQCHRPGHGSGLSGNGASEL